MHGPLLSQGTSFCCPPSRSRGSGQRAFTLIELLAVIAVIGILAAILIPVIGGVRSKAHQAECTSNLRSIGSALRLFAMEHNGMFPGPVMRGQRALYGQNPNSLLFHLGPYMGLGDPPDDGVRFVEAFSCPAHRAAASDPESPVWWLNHEAVVIDSDTRVNPWGHPNSKPEPGKPIRALKIEHPARQMVMQDVDAQIPAGWAGIPEEPVHGNVRNRLFFDGHVEAVPADLGREVMSTPE